MSMYSSEGYISDLVERDVFTSVLKILGCTLESLVELGDVFVWLEFHIEKFFAELV